MRTQIYEQESQRGCLALWPGAERLSRFDEPPISNAKAEACGRACALRRPGWMAAIEQQQQRDSNKEHKQVEIHELEQHGYGLCQRATSTGRRFDSQAD